MNFAKFRETAFLQNTSGRLFLLIFKLNETSCAKQINCSFCSVSRNQSPLLKVYTEHEKWSLPKIKFSG